MRQSYTCKAHQKLEYGQTCLAYTLEEIFRHSTAGTIVHREPQHDFCPNKKPREPGKRECFSRNSILPHEKITQISDCVNFLLPCIFVLFGEVRKNNVLIFQVMCSSSKHAEHTGIIPVLGSGETSTNRVT